MVLLLHPNAHYEPVRQKLCAEHLCLYTKIVDGDIFFAVVKVPDAGFYHLFGGEHNVKVVVTGDEVKASYFAKTTTIKVRITKE